MLNEGMDIDVYCVDRCVHIVSGLAAPELSSTITLVIMMQK
jgi:hypothetical protein